MQESVLDLIVGLAGMLAGGTVYFLFLHYKFEGEYQLRRKVRGEGFDPARRGAWYAQHVTRRRDLVAYTLIAIASTAGVTSLFWLLLSPHIFYLFWSEGASFLSAWALILLMCLSGFINSCSSYKYWGADRPDPTDDELEPDEMDAHEDGARPL